MDDQQERKSPGFIDRFSDKEARASGELWERELQRLLINEGELEASDDARIESLVDSCLENSVAALPHAPRRIVRRGRRAIWLAAALPLVGALSWAAHGVLSQETSPAKITAPVETPHAQASTSQAPAPTPSPPLAAEQAIQASAEAPTPDEQDQVAQLLPTSRQAPAPVTESPMHLFKKLKSAQAAGKMSSFFDLGRQLQARFPQSSEAQVSRILLGRALLASDSASSALQQFNAYRSHGGAMNEEAIVGQARASARLGLRAKELDAWRTLVRDFPASVHASQAQQRIAALTAR